MLVHRSEYTVDTERNASVWLARFFLTLGASLYSKGRILSSCVTRAMGQVDEVQRSDVLGFCCLSIHGAAENQASST